MDSLTGESGFLHVPTFAAFKSLELKVLIISAVIRRAGFEEDKVG
jgi:hypothetical protein